MATPVQTRGWKGQSVNLLLSDHVAKYPAIAASLTFSTAALTRLRSALNADLGVPADISPTVAIAGSLARLEGSSNSDLDLMIVYPNANALTNAPEKSVRIRAALHAIPTADAGGKTFSPPNPKGVFKDDIDATNLITEIGQRAEDYRNVSRRLLLLLESQSLWNSQVFDDLREQIVDSYTRAMSDDSSKQFVLLLNDLIRYFRTICVHYHSEMQSEYGRWPIRNIKLRHSRILMYGSLLIWLGELSKFRYIEKQRASGERAEKLAMLKEIIGYPPLERFVRAYQANSDDNLFRLLGPYNIFLEEMADPRARAELEDLDYGNRYSRPVFASLKANSDAFAAEITRFIYARRGQWSDRFFEYLLI